MQKKVTLKPGKEKAILNRHHWIFSGAIHELPSFDNGDILPVYQADHKLLGHAYFNKKSSIIGRMISFGDQNVIDTVFKHLKEAIDLRQNFRKQNTNAYRLVNAEGDFLPGLIIDQYDNVLVIQISTLGMDRLKAQIVDWLIKNVKPIAIYEKSNAPSRKDEGLSISEGMLHGKLPEGLIILENGYKFRVDIVGGQKTGFFLDQRVMREQIGSLSNGKRVLNCFSYTGGFSVYAAMAGASHVGSVDISKEATMLAEENLKLNPHQSTTKCISADVFDFLRTEPLDYDLVILDPPAFAKRQKDIVQACRGYKDINRIAMQKMPSNSLLLTCSCSYFVDSELFQKVIFQAAVEAKREVRIIGKHREAFDHPINIFHPEGNYLKSLLVYII